MQRAQLTSIAALVATVVGCTAIRPSSRPSACCAAPGYTRTQVESVLGQPAPPQSSKWHPFPSPPPDQPIYTTEHGYLTVTYTGQRHIATHFSMDFYEGKAPSEAFRLAGAYLPNDAVDANANVIGAKSNVHTYRSEKLENVLPATRGLIYVECRGPNPGLLCNTMDIVLGKP